MLSYLSTDHKMRIMEKTLRKMQADQQRMAKLGNDALEKKRVFYEKMLIKYNARLKKCAEKVVNKMPPSRLNRLVAGVVAYSEARKKIIEVLHAIKQTKQQNRSKQASQGILGYAK